MKWSRKASGFAVWNFLVFEQQFVFSNSDILFTRCNLTSIFTVFAIFYLIFFLNGYINPFIVHSRSSCLFSHWNYWIKILFIIKLPLSQKWLPYSEIDFLIALEQSLKQLLYTCWSVLCKVLVWPFLRFFREHSMNFSRFSSSFWGISVALIVCCYIKAILSGWTSNPL